MKDIIYLIRIKKGTSIFQDMTYSSWPECKPPQSEYKNDKWKRKTKFPNALFTAIKKNGYWDCKRDGYGHLKSRGDLGEYGNGSIFVYNKDGVDIIGININIKE